MSAPEPDQKSRPGPLPGVVRITRKEAAKGQLEAAILLWFHEQDIASVHTLTIAAQGVLDAICRDMKQPRSPSVLWIESKPKAFQNRIRSPQNFFKHGNHTQPYKDVVSYKPDMAETFTIDNVAIYQRLFDTLTPLMFAFALRFSLSHPKALPLDLIEAKISERVEVEGLRRLNRSEFLEKLLPLVIKRS